MNRKKTFQKDMTSICCGYLTDSLLKLPKPFLKKILVFDPDFTLRNALKIGVFSLELCQYYLEYAKNCFSLLLFYLQQNIKLSQEIVIFSNSPQFDPKATPPIFLFNWKHHILFKIIALHEKSLLKPLKKILVFWIMPITNVKNNQNN